MRIILATALMTASLVAIVPLHRAAPRSEACSIAPERMHERIREAEVIAVVRAISVGDAVNRAAVASPTSRPADPTQTGAGSARPTRWSSLVTPTPSLPPYERPPLPRGSDIFELTGTSARVSVERAIVGAPGTELDVDVALRARIERSLRSIESGGPRSSCSPGLGTSKYEPSMRYLAFLTPDYEGGLETSRLFQLDGEYIVDDSIGVPLDVYRQYFADLDAQIIPPEPEFSGYAYVDAKRLPLSRMIAAITAIREGRPVVLPPNTGSAGLKGHEGW